MLVVSHSPSCTLHLRRDRTSHKHSVFVIALALPTHLHDLTYSLVIKSFCFSKSCHRSIDFFNGYLFFFLKLDLFWTIYRSRWALSSCFLFFSVTLWSDQYNCSRLSLGSDMASIYCRDGGLLTTCFTKNDSDFFTKKHDIFMKYLFLIVVCSLKNLFHTSQFLLFSRIGCCESCFCCHISLVCISVCENYILKDLSISENSLRMFLIQWETFDGYNQTFHNFPRRLTRKTDLRVCNGCQSWLFMLAIAMPSFPNLSPTFCGPKLLKYIKRRSTASKMTQRWSWPDLCQKKLTGIVTVREAAGVKESKYYENTNFFSVTSSSSIFKYNGKYNGIDTIHPMFTHLNLRMELKILIEW